MVVALAAHVVFDPVGVLVPAGALRQSVPPECCRRNQGAWTAGAVANVSLVARWRRRRLTEERSPDVSDIPWLDDPDEACRRAKAEGKLALIDFFSPT